MAVVKHLNNHSGNYIGALRYLIYAHDEVCGKAIKDSNGDYVLRERFLMDGINCEPFSFAAECVAYNLSCGKNLAPDDITAHHYIISFDPNDADYGLTDEEAHAMVVNLSRDWFGGHQCIVFTHPDGDNHAGNIHSHVVLNSLRKIDEPVREGMEDKCYWKAGYKHQAADIFVNALKQAVMSMCQERGLNQVDLLNVNRERVTEKEYWVERRAKIADAKAATQSAQSKQELPTYTRNAQIRKAIRSSIDKAANFDNFIQVMSKDHNIDVVVRGANISFKHPESKKPIFGKRLGLDFELPVIKNAIEAKSLGEKTHTSIGLIASLQDLQKAKRSVAYARKVRISNVKIMAETISFLQRNNIVSVDELDDAIDIAHDTRNEFKAELDSTESQLKQTNVAFGAYKIYHDKEKFVQGYRAAKNKQTYYAKYRHEINEFSKSKRRLKEIFGDDNIPTMDTLKKQKQTLEVKRNSEYEKWCDARLKLRELSNVKQNVEHLLGGEGKRKQDKEISEER